MELLHYYESGVRHLCTSSSEYVQLHDPFFTIDKPYGPPDDLDTPVQLLTEWRNWSHRKSQELGFSAKDSERHISEGDVVHAEQGPPKRPLVRLPPLEAPCGVYPRHFSMDKCPPDAPETAPLEADLLVQFEEDPCHDEFATLQLLHCLRANPLGPKWQQKSSRENPLSQNGYGRRRDTALTRIAGDGTCEMGAASMEGGYL
eukprot:2348114-Amphidinium_carterae.3